MQSWRISDERRIERDAYNANKGRIEMEIGESTKLPSFSDEGFGIGKIELPGNVVEIHKGAN